MSSAAAAARFNFTDKEHRTYTVMANMILHFECMSECIAHMYFTNGNGEFIHVPPNVSVYKYSASPPLQMGSIDALGGGDPDDRGGGGGVRPTKTLIPVVDVTDSIKSIASTPQKNTRTVTVYTTTYYGLHPQHQYDIYYDDTLILGIQPQYCWKFINHVMDSKRQ